MNTCPRCGKITGVHGSVLPGCMCQYSTQPGEPVAWVMVNPSHLPSSSSLHWEPLYTAPQPKPDDTALLQQALEALTAAGLSAHKTKQVRNEAIAALRERLK